MEIDAKTFCCGAGGGRMWRRRPINGCPCCVRKRRSRPAPRRSPLAVRLTMMTDGVKSCGSGADVEDVAENLAKRLGL